MKELIHYRATIFVESPIGYTKDNVDRFPLNDWKCMPLSNDADSHLIDPFEDVEIKEDAYGKMQWKAINAERSMALVFLGQKIDLLGFPFVDEHRFLENCVDILCKISKAYHFDRVSRFAYSPTWGEKNGNFDHVLLLKSFKGKNAENVSLRNVFRVDEIIREKRIKINYLIQISTGYYNDNGKELPSVIYDVDINSLPEEKLSFDILEMKEFFGKVLRWSKEFIEQY